MDVSESFFVVDPPKRRGGSAGHFSRVSNQRGNECCDHFRREAPGTTPSVIANLAIYACLSEQAFFIFPLCFVRGLWAMKGVLNLSMF